mgnify:CR=1 FL=1
MIQRWKGTRRPAPLAPHWARFFENLGREGFNDLNRRTVNLERQVRDNGVTYNVYADPKGVDRPWEVDPLPLLLDSDEWREIEAGIVQRAELLNRVLADVYGEQQLLRSGALPASVIYGHGGYLHPAQGIRPAGDMHLFSYAADLARSPDGRWWVLGDRAQVGK